MSLAATFMRSRSFTPALRVIAALGMLLFGFAGAQASVRVVVTLPPWADLVARIAGPDASVETLLPAGTSPHAFDPAPSTMAAVARADLVVTNGGVDAWARELVSASGTRAPVVVLLDTPGLDLLGSDEGDVNPHVWLDPVRARSLVPVLVDALAEVDPEGRTGYAARGADLEAELAALHDELAGLLAPVRGAPFVPFHDAWPYFAERYGLNLVLEIEPFPGREPSPRVLAEVLAKIRDTGAPAIFAEAQLGERAARVLADEAGVDLAVLDPLGGREGRTRYEDLLRYNARTVLAALGSETGAKTPNDAPTTEGPPVDSDGVDPEAGAAATSLWIRS